MLDLAGVRVLARAGLLAPVRPDKLLTMGLALARYGISPATGYAAGQRIAQRDDVTAVFAANDSMALGLLRAFAEAGRSVPGDLSVVGFDDIPAAAYLLPPLTTVHQDFAAVGRRAIDVLHAAITGVPEDLPRLVEPELVVRSSTGPVRG